ncbi:MAG TPA: HD domain-containing phosphohydrolase, partial [Spirochaetia bacterium]|nr:HD domain-containing phosphohydrolase [Spirochaetia bacterium]
KTLFNNIGDALFTADLNGNIVTANPAFYKILEMDPNQSPDNIASIYVYREALEEKIMKLTTFGSLYNQEAHLFTGNRQVRRLLDSSWIVKNESGIIKGYTSHFRDVTYLSNLKAKLQISEQNYIMLFDTVISSIVIVDPLGSVINWNYAAEELYGYTWEKVVGRSFDELFSFEPKRPSIQEIFRRVDENLGRYVESNVSRLCEGHAVKYTYASYTWIKNSLDEVIAYAVMERDFTERVKLETKLRDAFEEIKETQTATILGFARLTEYREKDAGKHQDRIKNYTKVLAAELSKLPAYIGYITDNYIEDLCLSSVLHDIGKIGIEDSILFKKGKLSVDEFNQIKSHVSIGGQALRAVDTEIKRESFLTIGKEIAFSHHEWWDGNGYPEGKRGTDIPLSARIVALADVYDALTTQKSYKRTLFHEQAVEEIARERGTHFDPDIVNIFIEKNEVFKRIKMFSEFQEHPESIDDILKGRLKVDLQDLGLGH